jgi:hypothetical protein
LNHDVPSTCSSYFGTSTGSTKSSGSGISAERLPTRFGSSDYRTNNDSAGEAAGYSRPVARSRADDFNRQAAAPIGGRIMRPFLTRVLPLLVACWLVVWFACFVPAWLLCFYLDSIRP